MSGDSQTTERRCTTCNWWGTEEETHHAADERTCTWPKPFWMPIWKSHRDNILSRGCKTWEPTPWAK